jgi:hypothetical protein
MRKGIHRFSPFSSPSKPFGRCGGARVISFVSPGGFTLGWNIRGLGRVIPLHEGLGIPSLHLQLLEGLLFYGNGSSRGKEPEE